MRATFRTKGIGSVALVIILLATAVVIASPSVRAATASPWSANIRVNDGTSPLPNQFEPYLVLGSGGKLTASWIDSDLDPSVGFTTSTVSLDARARSSDRGNSWSPSIELSLQQLKDNQGDPWLAVDELGYLYYSYTETTQGGNTKVLVTRSTDGGATWGSATRVDTVHDFADKPSIASDGNGTLYVAYANLFVDVRLSRSTDRGVTWSTPVPFSDGGGKPVGTVMAARPNGTVTVLWQDVQKGNIYADTSYNRGSTWHQDVAVTDAAGSVASTSDNFPACCLPTLAATSKDSLFAAWPDHRTGNLDILASRSDDAGRSWSRNVKVNDDPTTRWQWDPAVAVDGRDQVHLTWVDNRTGNGNIFYSTSSDGHRWSKNERVTDAETPNALRKGQRDYMGLVADAGGTVYAAWVDGRNGNLDIYFARRSSSTASVVLSPLHDMIARVEVEERRLAGLGSREGAVGRWAASSMSMCPIPP